MSHQQSSNFTFTRDPKRLREPLGRAQVKALIRSILERGVVHFTRHALEQMAEDGLIRRDVVVTLRAGAVGENNLERGTWRYRVHAGRVTVVITFRSESALAVVTAWRQNP